MIIHYQDVYIYNNIDTSSIGPRYEGNEERLVLHPFDPSDISNDSFNPYLSEYRSSGMWSHVVKNLNVYFYYIIECIILYYIEFIRYLERFM